MVHLAKKKIKAADTEASSSLSTDENRFSVTNLVDITKIVLVLSFLT